MQSDTVSESADADNELAHGSDDDVDADADTPMVDVNNPSEFKDKYFDSVALFYMMLQGKFLVPVPTINKIVDELRVTHELEHEFLFSFLRATLEKNDVDKEKVNEIMKNLVEHDIFNEAHNADQGLLRSDYMRQKYYRDKFNYVAPISIYLGTDKHG